MAHWRSPAPTKAPPRGPPLRPSRPRSRHTFRLHTSPISPAPPSSHAQHLKAISFSMCCSKPALCYMRGRWRPCEAGTGGGYVPGGRCRQQRKVWAEREVGRVFNGAPARSSVSCLSACCLRGKGAHLICEHARRTPAAKTLERCTQGGWGSYVMSRYRGAEEREQQSLTGSCAGLLPQSRRLVREHDAHSGAEGHSWAPWWAQPGAGCGKRACQRAHVPHIIRQRLRWLWHVEGPAVRATQVGPARCRE